MGGGLPLSGHVIGLRQVEEMTLRHSGGERSIFEGARRIHARPTR
jgi:hypothetical protein